MGTFSDSKIAKARKEHTCHDCGGKIRIGERYLRYKYGLRNDAKLCIDCGLVVIPPGDGWPDSRLKYDCAAVRTELGMEQSRTHAG